LHAGVNNINYVLRILLVHHSITHLTTKHAGKRLIHYSITSLARKKREIAAIEMVARFHDSSIVHVRMKQLPKLLIENCLTIL